MKFALAVLALLAVVLSVAAKLRAKRAINPFLDSMGKRAVNPFLDSIGKRSMYGYYPVAKGYYPVRGAYKMQKRYFDSLAGQSLGKRSAPFEAEVAGNY